MIIDHLLRQQPGKFFCLSTKSSSGKWVDHFFAKKDLPKMDHFIKQHADKDLYFCPHGFKEKRRRKECAVPPNLLWSDLDEVDPRKIPLRPSIAIESSPGRYVGLWYTDAPITEELNRRMTYYIGGDASGWDLTQVLRIPNTTNYKYRSNPRTRLLWRDGPIYTLDALERELPKLANEDSDADAEGAAQEVFDRYETKLPRWVRRELISGKPTEGKRSEVIWKLANTLIEKGMTRDEAFLLLKASPWNKFRGRASEDEQLRRELDKALSKHFKVSRPRAHDEDEDESEYNFVKKTLADVEERDMEWVWYPYLARGELTILEGDPGLGKSYLAQMVAGSICDGKELPSPKPRQIKGNVVYFDMENSADTVTKKRLRLNGFTHFERFYPEDQPFTVDDEDRFAAVIDAVAEVHPSLIVFDTLNSYIGMADIHRSNEATLAVNNFLEMAQRCNCPVLALRHITKSPNVPARYRGQGSQALAGRARFVLSVGTDPDDYDTRAMAVTKINNAPTPRALTFRINALPDIVKEQDRSRFEFGEYVDLTADQILGGKHEGIKNNDNEMARKWLEELLSAEGELESAKVERMAEAKSIDARALKRAIEDLGVDKRVERVRGKKTTFLAMPA